MYRTPKQFTIILEGARDLHVYTVSCNGLQGQCQVTPSLVYLSLSMPLTDIILAVFSKVATVTLAGSIATVVIRVVPVHTIRVCTIQTWLAGK